MKINIDLDELYPYYFATEHDTGVRVDLDLEKLEWIENTMKEFNKVQAFLEYEYLAQAKE